MSRRVVPHDPEWSAAFAAEADRIRSVMGRVVVGLHHIGSTAIPGIPAKPIIDMLLEVRDLPMLDSCALPLVGLGYEVKGEFGIPGRRYFRKASGEGSMACHLHAFESGSSGCERHLAFRDYLLAHPNVAQAYGRLKQRLAVEFPDSIEAYMNGKDSFIKVHEAKAVRWRERSP